MLLEHSGDPLIRSFIMKTTVRRLSVIFIFIAATVQAEEPKLWYDKPAGKWTEALPLGNGRLGAMVFGGTATERIQINEESLWAGCQVEAYAPDFKNHLAEVQRLVLAGKNLDAQQYGLAHLTQTPTSFRSYEPLGDIFLDFGDAGEVMRYRRELSLRDAIARTEYHTADATITREALVSSPSDVLAMRVSSDKPGGLSFGVRLTRHKDARFTVLGNDRLCMDGQIVDIAKEDGGFDDNVGGSGPGGAHMRFSGRLFVRSEGGTVAAGSDHSLQVSGADSALILFTAATDYHLNINLQMNYWPAPVTGLDETLDPLTGWFLKLAERGKTSARCLYGADGWVAFLATNPFGRVTPSASNPHSQFLNAVLDPLCGAWLAAQLFDAWQFDGDPDELEALYPVLEGASEFVLDILTECPDGKLRIVPSTSPENSYIDPASGEKLRITAGSTYHMAIVRALFKAITRAAADLGREGELTARVAAATAKLPPIAIGPDGRILEWAEPYREAEPGHRHVSHLIGLHPFDLITPDTPDLLRRRAQDHRHPPRQGRCRHRLEPRVDHQLLRPPARWRHRRRPLHRTAAPQHHAQPLQQSPAVPDRRQLRLHRRGLRNVGPKPSPRWRGEFHHRSPARAAEGLACRQRQRPAHAWRIHRGYEMARRETPVTAPQPSRTSRGPRRLRRNTGHPQG